MQSLLNLLAMLDELMTAAGALALLAGALLLGVYAWTREDLLVIEVAGDDDLELPVAEAADDDVADRLDRAVRPDEGSGEGESPPESTGDPLA